MNFREKSFKNFTSFLDEKNIDYSFRLLGTSNKMYFVEIESLPRFVFSIANDDGYANYPLEVIDLDDDGSWILDTVNEMKDFVRTKI